MVAAKRAYKKKELLSAKGYYEWSNPVSYYESRKKASERRKIEKLKEFDLTPMESNVLEKDLDDGWDGMIWGDVTDKSKSPQPKPVKKETPSQKKLRELKEENSKQKKKITELNKTIKTLKAEAEKLKARLPITINPDTVKRKSDVTRRFETMDIV